MDRFFADLYEMRGDILASDVEVYSPEYQDREVQEGSGQMIVPIDRFVKEKSFYRLAKRDGSKMLVKVTWVRSDFGFGYHIVDFSIAKESDLGSN